MLIRYNQVHVYRNFANPPLQQLNEAIHIYSFSCLSNLPRDFTLSMIRKYLP